VDYPRYDPQSPVTPLTVAELDALDRLLPALPTDSAMTLDGVDGFLTALLVGPPTLLASMPTADWLPWVWGGDGPGGPDEAAPFASKRQRKTTVVQLLRHLRHLAEQLQATPGDWQPIFSIAEQGPNEWADARDWCAGFLQAVDLLPQAWGDAWTDPVLAPLVVLGGGLEGVAVAADADSDDPAEIDRVSRTVPDAVLHLLARHAAPA
jgi:uncharacterized protein